MAADAKHIPAYVSRARLIRELDISDRTLDNWLAQGFPKSKKHAGLQPRWKWAEVEAYMDGKPSRAKPATTEGMTDEEIKKEIDERSRTFFEQQAATRQQRRIATRRANLKASKRNSGRPNTRPSRAKAEEVREGTRRAQEQSKRRRGRGDPWPLYP